MTDILSIVEKFTMTIDGPPPARDSWFLDYVLRSPNQAGKHLTAGWLTLNSLLRFHEKAPFTNVVEHFGGMGAQALMAEYLFSPIEHYVADYSQDAVDHLRSLTELRYCKIEQADAYDRKNQWVGDLTILDFGDLTCWKTRDGEPHRQLLDRVFSCKPRAVVLTDIACRYLHLHRERYESLLGDGTCASYPLYLGALSNRFQDLYGYRVWRGYRDRWSTVMALVPGETMKSGSPGIIDSTPDSPVGLEIL